MKVYNPTGILKKVLIYPPIYHEVIPIREVAKKHIDAGGILGLGATEREYVGVVDDLRGTSIDIIWGQPYPEHHWQAFTRDFGTNTKSGPFIGNFRYPKRPGDEEFAIEVLDPSLIELPMAGYIHCLTFDIKREAK